MFSTWIIAMTLVLFCKQGMSDDSAITDVYSAVIEQTAILKLTKDSNESQLIPFKNILNCTKCSTTTGCETNCAQFYEDLLALSKIHAKYQTVLKANRSELVTALKIVLNNVTSDVCTWLKNDIANFTCDLSVVLELKARLEIMLAGKKARELLDEYDLRKITGTWVRDSGVVTDVTIPLLEQRYRKTFLDKVNARSSQQ